MDWNGSDIPHEQIDKQKKQDRRKQRQRQRQRQGQGQEQAQQESKEGKRKKEEENEGEEEEEELLSRKLFGGASSSSKNKKRKGRKGREASSGDGSVGDTSQGGEDGSESGKKKKKAKSKEKGKERARNVNSSIDKMVMRDIKNSKSYAASSASSVAMSQGLFFEDRVGNQDQDQDQDQDQSHSEAISLETREQGSKNPTFRENSNPTTATTAITGPAPAWEDEDDDNLLVDLSVANRLRKLRKSEAEADAGGSIIGGKEFQKRLREQHQNVLLKNKSRFNDAYASDALATDRSRAGTGTGTGTGTGPGTEWAALSPHSGKDSKKSSKRKDYSPSKLDEWELRKATTAPFRKTATNGTSQGTSSSSSEKQSVAKNKDNSKRASRDHFVPLPSNRLAVSRVSDANQRSPSTAVVQCIDWHQNTRLFLTAGMDKTVRLFDIDGKTNDKLQSIHFEDLPIYQAKFAGPKHDEVICSGRRKFYYSCDLARGEVSRIPGVSVMGKQQNSLESFEVSPNGDLLAFLCSSGYVCFVSHQDKKPIGSVKLNGNVRCASFAGPLRPYELFTSGEEGEVYVWDVRKLGSVSQCVVRHKDLGSLGTCSIAVSPCDGTTYAVGSNSGVVNLYRSYLHDESDSVKPVNSFMNLTTAVDELKFNHDGQMLAMLSRRKKESLRIAHTGTMSVFSNWPTSRTPLSYASCVTFSPHSGMFACGNDKGRVLLYRLKHYMGT